jgi:hypothetical protein
VASSDGCGCGWRDRHDVALAGVTATGYVDGGRGWAPPPLAVLPWRGWSGTSSHLRQRRLVARTSAGWWWWRQAQNLHHCAGRRGSGDGGGSLLCLEVSARCCARGSWAKVSAMVTPMGTASPVEGIASPTLSSLGESSVHRGQTTVASR